MEYVRTVRVPVHYLTTKKKASYLERLTARLTCSVRLWARMIEEHGLKTRSDCSPFERMVGEETGLSAGFVQQARDKAIWMWESYREAHRRWRWMLSKAKKGTKWYEKLKKREPSPPFTSKRSRLKKTPTRFDYRTGQVQRADLVLTNWVIHISTLKRGETIDVLLTPSEHHEKLLSEGEIKDFEIVKKNGWYYVHVACRFKVRAQPIRRIVGVDLGICRSASTVSISPANLSPSHFRIFRDEKRDWMKELNDRASHLRRLEKWETLKKLRHRRRNVANQLDRRLAKRVAEACANSYVFLGDPEYIRYHKFRGNGNKTGRRLLQGWSFDRQIQYIQHECAKLGIPSETLNEWGTSSRCHRCGGRAERSRRSRIICPWCGLRYDADFNSAINIAQKGISRLDDKSLASPRL